MSSGERDEPDSRLQDSCARLVAAAAAGYSLPGNDDKVLDRAATPSAAPAPPSAAARASAAPPPPTGGPSDSKPNSRPATVIGAFAATGVRSRTPSVADTLRDSAELQSEYVNTLLAADVVFECPSLVPKSAHGFEPLIPYLSGDLPELHPLLRRVAEVARAEYKRFTDPLLAWRSESALHGPLRRLLRVVMTPEAADRGTSLTVSPRVMTLLYLDDLAEVCPDLSVGISAKDLIISLSHDEPEHRSDAVAIQSYTSRCAVLPTLSGVSLDTDWFHFLFVESKPGGTRAGTLRVLTAMRAALQLAHRLYAAAKAAEPVHYRLMGDMAIAYGVVTSGACWEVHSMSIEERAEGVVYKTHRLWEGYVDRPRDLMQFIAIMRIAIVGAQRRSEIVGNWLWCLRHQAEDGARRKPAAVEATAAASSIKRKAEAVASGGRTADEPVTKRQASGANGPERTGTAVAPGPAPGPALTAPAPAPNGTSVTSTAAATNRLGLALGPRVGAAAGSGSGAAASPTDAGSSRPHALLRHLTGDTSHPRPHSHPYSHARSHSYGLGHSHVYSLRAHTGGALTAPAAAGPTLTADTPPAHCPTAATVTAIVGPTSANLAASAGAAPDSIAQRWAATQERIGQWRNGVRSVPPRLPMADM